MSPAPITWELVDRTAAALGASAIQRRKWRAVGRQVPPTWRIKIAEQLKADGKPIELAGFDDLPPRPGRLSTEGTAA